MRFSIIRLLLVIMFILCMIDAVTSQCGSDSSDSTGCDGNSYSESISSDSDSDSGDGAAYQSEQKVGADSLKTLPQNVQNEEISAEIVGLIIAAGIIGLLLGGCIVGGIWYFKTKSKQNERGYVPQLETIEEENVNMDQDGDGEYDEEAYINETR